MSLTKIVNGLEVPMSAEEEAALRAEWDAAPAPEPVLTATAFLDRLGSDGPALAASSFGFALIRLAAAGTIRLDDPEVVAGMQSAVQAGAISAARAAELLTP